MKSTILLNEERKKKRKPVLKSVAYIIVPSIIDKTYDGIITDISDSGACLLTTSHIKNRQRIIIQDKTSSFEQAAIVRWSQKYDDLSYKIGLEFIEDQTFMNTRDKRRYRRLNVKTLDIHGKMTFAHYLKIVDISLGGLLMETDRKLNIGEQYTLHLEYEGRRWSIKGYIIRSTLKESKNENQDNIIPIYSIGMKITSAFDEIKELIKFLELRQKEDGKKRIFSFESR